MAGAAGRGCFPLWTLIAVALASSSSRADFDAGGARATSGDIAVDSSISAIAAVAQTDFALHAVHAGFIGQIYDVAGLLVQAVPSTVPSEGSSQLMPAALLDDSTILALSPLEVNWDPAVFPVTSITPAGVLTVAVVSLATNFDVGAHYLGFAAQTRLTVSPNRQQTIAFDPLPDRWYGDPPFILIASASSGLPVSFTVLSGPARLAGNVLALTGPGSITVRAIQPGNADYEAALDREQTFRVLSPVGGYVGVRRFPGTNVVKIGLSKFAIPGTRPASFASFDPSGRNGGAISGEDFRLVFNPASDFAPDSFTCVVQATSGVQITNTVSVTVIDNLLPRIIQVLTEDGDYVFGIAADPGRPWTIECSTNLISGWHVLGPAAEAVPGIYELRDNAPADTRRFYRAVQAAKMDQTITLDPLVDKVLGDPPFPLLATTSSGLPVSFSLLSGPATLSSNTLTITGTGVVTIRAAQSGNANYNPAPLRDRAFDVLAPVGRLASVRRFPGTNVVKIGVIRLAGAGHTLVSSDLTARNGGTITSEDGRVTFTPASSHGSDNFVCVLRSPTGSQITNTVSVTVLEHMTPRWLYILVEADDYVLGFAGNARQTCIVQHTTDPISGWSTLGAALETVPGVFQLRDPAPAAARRFYRITNQ